MTDSTPGVVAFCMPVTGHLHRTMPVVVALSEAGIPVHFFTDECARADVERAGARFVNLFSRQPFADVDPATTHPVTGRCVTFAGVYGDDVAREVEPLRPRLVLHDALAVIGRVVAHHLRVPRVTIRPAGIFDPQALLRQYQAVPSAGPSVSDRCREAVRLLQDRHGMPDASPYSAFVNTAGDLNLYSEPREFAATNPDEPADTVEHFGSIWPAAHVRPAGTPSPFGPGAEDRVRVYISFGTVVWGLRAAEAEAALDALSDAIAGMPSVTALISLGGRDVSGAARLARPNVRVERYVDQIRVLQEASVFVTHHGLNSTHEAIYHGVPMISYPFIWDQPGIAARCQELGIAVPLVPEAMGPVTPADVRLALDRLVSGGEPLRERLDRARQWELDTIARRPAVVQRIRNLMA